MVSIKVCIIFVVFVFACLTKGQSGQEKTRLQKLESIVTALQQKVESLEWKNELQQQQIDNQQAEIQQLQAELESEKLTADLVKKELQTLYDKLHVERRQIENEDIVAFYGKLNELVSDIGQDEIVKFNNIITDVGHAYDSSTGLFTAPVPGLYVFSTTVMVQLYLDTHLGIYVNNQMKTNIKLHGTEHEYDTMSQTVIYYLKKSDTVSVRHYEGNKTIHGDYTSLTGFLLNQDYGQISGVIPITVLG